MQITPRSLELVFDGFKTVYTDAFMNADLNWDKISMRVSSSGSSETYGWMGQFPQLREWIGQRHIHRLTDQGFKIQNLDFESTVSVPANDIMDDKLGIFRPAISEMGQLAAQHPEEVIFSLLKDGFTTECFDGQNFFDADHPLKDKDGINGTVSNFQDGSQTPWYLLDTSRALRPIVWQERQDYSFTYLNRPEDPHVFMNNEYIYGIHARVNAGFGIWQLAYASKADLTPENYRQARAAMMDFRSDGGRVLGIKPTMLVVPPSLEQKALEILNSEFQANGASNPWSDTAEMIVSPFLNQ